MKFSFLYKKTFLIKDKLMNKAAIYLECVKDLNNTLSEPKILPYYSINVLHPTLDLNEYMEAKLSDPKFLQGILDTAAPYVTHTFPFSCEYATGDSIHVDGTVETHPTFCIFY